MAFAFKRVRRSRRWRDHDVLFTMPMIFPFDPDIRRASTIPARLYVDPVFLELERERVFAHRGNSSAGSDQVAETGSFFTAEVGNDSIVVLRDGDALRASTTCACTAPVRWRTGAASDRRCSASTTAGRTRLDGSSCSARPAWSDVRTLHRRRDAPRAGAVELGSARLRESRRKGAAARAVPRRPPGARAPSTRVDALRDAQREYELACNWKVYVDNYLEGYHIPVVHPRCTRSSTTTAIGSSRNAILDPACAAARCRGRRCGDRLYRPDAKTDVAEAVYVWLFPNIMLNVYFGQLQTNVVLPVGTIARRRLRVVRDSIRASTPQTRRLGARIAFSDEIQDEDVEICEIVQRNLRSRVYDRGRYSAARREGRPSLPLAATRVPDLTAPHRARPRPFELLMRRSLSLRSGIAHVRSASCLPRRGMACSRAWGHNHIRRCSLCWSCRARGC